MNFLRRNIYYIYKILTGCENDNERKSICNLVNNFLYINAFSPKQVSNEYLFVIYCLIKKEMKIISSGLFQKLFENNSFFVYLCQDLMKKYEFLIYFKHILAPVIEYFDKLQME